MNISFDQSRILADHRTEDWAQNILDNLNEQNMTKAVEDLDELQRSPEGEEIKQEREPESFQDAA